MVRSWNQVKEADWKAMRFGSWLTAALQRARKMPSLQQVLTGGRGPTYTRAELEKASEFHERLLRKRAERNAAD